MNKPYINDALVGNGRLLAAFSADGEMQRCWWPSIDFGQHVNRFRVGVARDHLAPIEWLDGSKADSMAYLGETNILTWSRKAAGLDIRHVSFAVPGHDLLVHRMEVDGHLAQSARLVANANLHINEQPRYQSLRFHADEGAFVHYFRDVYIAIGFLEGRPDAYQGGGMPASCSVRDLNGVVGGLGSESVMAKQVLGAEAPNGGYATLCLSFGSSLQECLDGLKVARDRGYKNLLAMAETDARDFLATATKFPELFAEAVGTTVPADWSRHVYHRSLLTFQLLQGESGAMIAAPEFDESFQRCGGYAYCWGRDAAFIVSALEKVSLEEQADRFYQWAVRVQEADGLWEHRHYLDGKLAPSWGVQYDESASLLWGLSKRALLKRDQGEYVRAIWPAARLAAARLLALINPDTHLLSPSVDLWEERVAEHLYSTAAGIAGLRSFATLCQDDVAMGQLDGDAEPSASTDVPPSELANLCLSAAERMESAISHAVSSRHGGFLRGRMLCVDPDQANRCADAGDAVHESVDAYGYRRYAVAEDHTVDVSLLGLAVPFDVIEADHDVMRKTAQLIESRLTREVGGIGRYEGDPYIGGNPWILATLWLGLYKLRIGDEQGAMESVRWALGHATALGFLPEQVDRNTGATAWVNPLAWSHAMYVWFVSEWARLQA